MPKATWGAGDNALTSADVDNAERSEPRTRYSGEMPPGGTYRWTVSSLKKDTSSTGNPKLVVMLELDGSWMPNHKQYDGAPHWDHLPVLASTKERVANFLDAIGATGADLLEKCVVDENGYVTKLGAIGDPKGIQVFCTVRRKKITKEYPNPALEGVFNPYIMVTEDDGAGATSEGEEPPF
jgi:hypothetical protein